jgi:uncharacterized protein
VRLNPLKRRARTSVRLASSLRCGRALALAGGLRAPQKRYIIYTMFSFEFDEQKSRVNSAKHGIDFVEAQGIWSDPDFVEIPARALDEPRFLVIGRIEGKHWSAVITYRRETVRIISVRRSRVEEVALYEG